MFGATLSDHRAAFWTSSVALIVGLFVGEKESRAVERVVHARGGDESRCAGTVDSSMLGAFYGSLSAMDRRRGFADRWGPVAAGGGGNGPLRRLRGDDELWRGGHGQKH
ncbi:hypothetical protein MRB53_038183 [Persea americana]|nr:hypothetical protein MRB53_038183 [Persea americana]